MMSSVILRDDFSRHIVESISKVYEDEELQDYKVQVESTVYGCHRLMLCAVSEFFQCLMRSDMIETRNNFVQLKDISSSTFALILKLVYTGEDVVTPDNFIELWHASDRLGIAFLMVKCQEMARCCITAENCGKIYQAAKLLESRHVLKQLSTLMVSKFKQIKENGTFLLLEFEDFLKIISSDELVVPSEDFVLFSVVDWVMNVGHGECEQCSQDVGNIQEEIKEYITGKEDSRAVHTKLADPICCEVSLHCNAHLDTVANMCSPPRSVYLTRLLEASRYHLASNQCLSEIFLHPLIQQNQEARTLIFFAVLDKIWCVQRRRLNSNVENKWIYCPDDNRVRLVGFLLFILFVMILAWANE